MKKDDTEDEDGGNGERNDEWNDDRLEEKAKLTAEKGNEGRTIGKEEEGDIKRSPKPGTLLNAAPAIINFLKDLLKTIVFEKLSCHLCFGLNDPADTAVMSGYLWSVASTLGLFRANVFIEPYFEGERLEGVFEAELKARLIQITIAVINALREKEIRSLIRDFAGWN